MSPEKTIRWAAALYAFPFLFSLFALVVEAMGAHPGRATNFVIVLVILTPPACLVAFSSRVAAGVSLTMWGLMSLVLVTPSVTSMLNGNFHLLITKIRVLGLAAYCVATAVLLFSAFRAAQEIQLRKKGPDLASVFE